MPRSFWISYDGLEDFDAFESETFPGYVMVDESETFSQTISKIPVYLPNPKNKNINEKVQQVPSKNIQDPVDHVKDNPVPPAKKEKHTQVFELPAEKPNKNRGLGYIAAIVITLIVIVGLIAVGYSVAKDKEESEVNEVGVNEPDQDDIGSVAATEQDYTTEIPSLKAMFGLTSDEVGTLLGGDYQTSGTSEITDSTVARRVTYVYSPDPTVELDNPPTIRLSLDSDGAVIAVYYVASMELLGYPASDFSTLVATSDSFTSILQSLEVEYVDFEYEAPSVSEYTTYLNESTEMGSSEMDGSTETEESSENSDESSASKIPIKESYSITGDIDSEEVPTVWAVGFTYTYPDADENESGEAVRLLEIELS